MPDKGWISIDRKLMEHWIWEETPFSRGQAWIDLLLLANYTDKKMVFGNEVITINRGDVVTSQLKLSERWGWSKTKVRAFLKLLECDNMITQKPDRKKTTITIVNYSDFQDVKTTEKPQKDHEKTEKEPQKNCEETAEKPQKNTNNKDNNINNDNNINIIPPTPKPGGEDSKTENDPVDETSPKPKKTRRKKNTELKPDKINYAEFVTMTNAEYTALMEKHGEADTKRMIEILDNYKGSSGKTYQSDYRAILSWVVDRVAQEKKKVQANKPDDIYSDSYDHDELEKIWWEKLKK